MFRRDERKRVPSNKLFSGMKFKHDSGTVFILMGYTDWPGIGRESYFVSEDGQITTTIYDNIYEDQVICA